MVFFAETDDGRVRIGATPDVDKYRRKLAATFHELRKLLATMPAIGRLLETSGGGLRLTEPVPADLVGFDRRLSCCTSSRRPYSSSQTVPGRQDHERAESTTRSVSPLGELKRDVGR
jgi:hypothetical protein